MDISTLEALGISAESLHQKIVEHAVEELLGDRDYDLVDEIRFAVKAAINEAVDKLAEEEIRPRIAELIDTTTFQETNGYGEPKKDPQTFREYLISRAESFMTEQVNFKGKTKKEDGYSFNAAQSRVTYMIDKHIQYTMETSVEAALKSINSQLSKGIGDTVTLILKQTLDKVKVKVS